MKTLPIALTAISLCLFYVQAEPPPAELKAELIALEKQSWEEWKNHDGKIFLGFLSDDHIEIGFGGVTNKSQVVAGVSSGVCTVNSYSLEHFGLNLRGKGLALLTYRETQDTLRPNHPVVAMLGRVPLPEPRWSVAEHCLSTITNNEGAHGRINVSPISRRAMRFG